MTEFEKTFEAMTPEEREKAKEEIGKMMGTRPWEEDKEEDAQ